MVAKAAVEVVAEEVGDDEEEIDTEAVRDAEIEDGDERDFCVRFVDSPFSSNVVGVVGVVGVLIGVA